MPSNYSIMFHLLSIYIFYLHLFCVYKKGEDNKMPYKNYRYLYLLSKKNFCKYNSLYENKNKIKTYRLEILELIEKMGGGGKPRLTFFSVFFSIKFEF